MKKEVKIVPVTITKFISTKDKTNAKDKIINNTKDKNAEVITKDKQAKLSVQKKLTKDNQSPFLSKYIEGSLN